MEKNIMATGTITGLGKSGAELFVYRIVSAPLHVNINTVEAMPVYQAWSPFTTHRTKNTD